MDNRGLLAVIAVLMIGIVTVMMIQMNGGPVETVDENTLHQVFTLADRN